MTKDVELHQPPDVEFAASMFDNAPCGIVICDESNTLLKANRTFASWTGRASEELVRQARLQDFLTRPCRVLFEAQFAPMLRLQGFVREIALQIQRPGLGPLPVLLNAVLRRAEDGSERVDYMLFDATERNQYERSLREARKEAEQLSAIVTSSPDAILRVRMDGLVERWNPGAEKLLGVSAVDAAMANITSVVEVPRTPEWFCDASRRAEEVGRVSFEAKLKDGQHVEIALTPIDGEAHMSSTTSFSVVIRDISEIIAARQQAKLMMRELNHRVKNVLSVVIGVAKQTLSSEVPEREKFIQRLRSLARAHDVLVTARLEQANLHDLVQMTAVEAGGGENLQFNGPSLVLRAGQAVSLSMALHELVTNSIKYGALSRSEGHVDVIWDVDKERNLHLVWTEAGGPPVTEPNRRGFGTRMIERALTMEFGGVVKINFHRAGLLVDMRLPLI